MKKDKRKSADIDAAAAAAAVTGKKKAKGKKGGQPEAVTRKAKGFGSPIRNMIVTAVVSILLGVAFLAKPVLVYTYCGYGIGGLIALVGIVYIIIYFLRKPISGVYRSEFALGMVALLAGAYVAVGGLLTGGSTTTAAASVATTVAGASNEVSNTVTTAVSSGSTSITFEVIVRILGVLMAADGILKVQYSLDLIRMKYKQWWLSLIFSVLGIGLGVVTVMGLTYDLGGELGLKSTAFLSGAMMLGIAFCLNGVFDLIVMIIVIVRNRQANKAAAIAEAAAMMAAASQEKAADFFPAADTSVEEPAVPSAGVSAVTPAAAPAPEPEPAPAPAPAPEPAAAPAPEPAAEAEPASEAPAGEE